MVFMRDWHSVKATTGVKKSLRNEWSMSPPQVVRGTTDMQNCREQKGWAGFSKVELFNEMFNYCKHAVGPYIW